MIGLDIRVENSYSNNLYKIFDGIDLLKYVWEIHTDSILYTENGSLKESLFRDDLLNGEDFLRCISRDSYYMIFVDIKAYPIGSKSIEIKTFEDFSKSNCEMVLLCADTIFIEFYCKDRSVLDKVYSSCIENQFETKYLTVEDVSGRSFVA